MRRGYREQEERLARRLEGKICLVTAGAQGIGRASALAFAQEGARVLATDINEQELEKLGKAHPLEVARLDVSRREDIDGLLLNRSFDVVLNCAGYVHDGTILDCDEDAWRRSFGLNIDSMFRVCRAVIPAMRVRGGGSIINVASVASSIAGVPRRFAYGTTKAAVIGLTKAIAADFVSDGIRCNAICPGTVSTPSLADRVAALGPDKEANWKMFTNRQPMGRLGRPEEIAALAVHLASDESAFTTGSLYIADGGWTN